MISAADPSVLNVIYAVCGDYRCTIGLTWLERRSWLDSSFGGAGGERDGRLGALSGAGGQAGLLHPAPDAVSAAAFGSQPGFFASFDKVQVKYEMLRAHVLGGRTATTAAGEHGYSRAS